MAYISTRVWRDLTDRHLYAEGDPFPFDGREVPAERLEALEHGSNRAGLRLIRRAEPEETPKLAAEPPKPAKPRTRKPAKSKG